MYESIPCNFIVTLGRQLYKILEVESPTTISLIYAKKHSKVCNDPPRYDDKPHITSAILFFFLLKVCARVYKGNKHIRLCVATRR
jgi:hypothetical protein